MNQYKLKEGDYNMKIQTITSLIVVIMVVSITLFSGCVEEETRSPTETPAVTPSPTSTIGQEMTPPTPTPTPKAAWKPNVTLKSGYTWYQDDEFGYGFGYPEKWQKVNLVLTEGLEGGVTFVGSDTLASTDFPEAMILVMVYSNSTSLKFWESPAWVEHGGLEKAKEMGIVSKYGNTTINGRDGFELIYDPIMVTGFSKTPRMRERMIIFTVDDLDYVVRVSTNALERDLYDKYEDTFDDVINSFIIE